MVHQVWVYTLNDSTLCITVQLVFYLSIPYGNGFSAKHANVGSIRNL